MCGLCGNLGDNAHWSDASPGRPAQSSALSWLRRAERRAHVAAANRALAPIGLFLADWQGACFMLSKRTGGAVEVGGLGDLWMQADRLSGKKLDPLDEATLADVARGNKR